MKTLFVLLLLTAPAWAETGYGEAYDRQMERNEAERHTLIDRSNDQMEHEAIEGQLRSLNNRLEQREQERRDLQYELRQRCIRLHYPYIAECGYY